MSTAPTKNSPSARYGLVVFLILTLFVFASFFYVRYDKRKDLSIEIHNLSQLQENYALIDSSILFLYKAENNSRLYLATGDKSYLSKFTTQINHVSSLFDNINSTLKRDSSIDTKNVSSLVKQKQVRTEMYLKVRSMTDSLINLSASLKSAGQNTVNVAHADNTFSNFKTLITIDTITINRKDEKQKKFFGRIGDAFKGNKKKGESDPDLAYLKTEISIDNTLKNRNFNKLQTKLMSDYFRALYSANVKLRKNEIDVLRINNKLIGEIVSLLQTYKKDEIAYVAKNKATINENINNAFKSIDKIFIFIITLLVLLVFTIIYNVWKIYKHEQELVKYSKDASQFASTKSRFLANMSHEIRTPLNSVIGFSEQLSQGSLNPQQVEQVSAIRSSSVMLLDVVNDILDFSKYEIGKVKFDKVTFGPTEVISEVFNSITIQASKKDIELKNMISFEENFNFIGDSLRLKQVIMNLMSNAIKFTKIGTVTLIANVERNHKTQSILKVQIVDTGIGIGKDDIDMIFDEFAQVDYSSIIKKQAGTGLGLAICKKIVELQGGKISVTSEVGMGSTFSFEIPYEICLKEEKVRHIPSYEQAINGLEGKRILLADDNKMNILLAVTILKKYKIITDIAYDGREALELFKFNDYNLILTDIQMPEMGGVELTEIIRRDRDLKKSSTPILGVTANVLETDRKRYIQSGINDLVLKPFTERDLINKMAQYIFTT